MNKSGPVIVVEDDNDDQKILNDVFAQLDYPNKVIFFDDGLSAHEYLMSSKDQPFGIFQISRCQVMNCCPNFYFTIVRYFGEIKNQINC